MNQQYHCPYKESLETADAIWNAKIKAINELKKKGFSDKEIDEMVIFGCL
jgi:hypothetical protein